MIETPPSFAAAPDSGHDLLAETLRAVRLTGSVFLDACFTAPFGLISPKRFDANTPMAHLRHVSVFHLIASGGCSVQLANGECREVSAGDIMLMPFADQHKFSNGRAVDVPLADDIVRPGRAEGNSGPSTTAAAAPKPAWCAALSNPRNFC